MKLNMMTYSDLIDTIREIVDNDKIYKKNMMLVYELEEENHRKMDEHLFYTSDVREGEFNHRDIFDVVISDVTVRFIKK